MAEMLSQTKENIQNIVNKLTVYDFLLQTLMTSGNENKERAETLAKSICARKVVLVEEAERLLN